MIIFLKFLLVVLTFLASFFVARFRIFGDKFSSIFILLLNPIFILLLFFILGGIDTLSVLLFILYLVGLFYIWWKFFLGSVFAVEKLFCDIVEGKGREMKDWEGEGVGNKGKEEGGRKIDVIHGGVVELIGKIASLDIDEKFFDGDRAEGHRRFIFILRDIVRQIINEKERLDSMQKMFLDLTNFARYSFSETDKNKLMKEMGNFVFYAIRDKKVIVMLSEGEFNIKRKGEGGGEDKSGEDKTSEISSPFIFGNDLSEEEISDINLGKLEKEGKYVAFPIMKNGDAYAYLVLKGVSINQYERIFAYLVSKFAEAVIKRIDREEEIQRRAVTDPLTGIYNRRYLIQHLEQAYAKLKRFKKTSALIIFDLDGFKKINDVYGHFVGDEVLRAFASILKDNVRGYDVPARFGGDEFILLLDDITKEDSISVAKRISKRFSEMSSIKGMVGGEVTVSWGLATSDEAPESFEELIKLADRRLLRAKAMGRGKGFWG